MSGPKKEEATAKTAAPNHHSDLTKQLWQAAVELRGSIEPADYKRYVLPIVFLRFLSLRFEARRKQLEGFIAEPESEYHTGDPEVAKQILDDPDEYSSAGAFIVPEKARWSYLRKQVWLYAEYVRQLGGASPLHNLMEVKC